MQSLFFIMFACQVAKPVDHNDSDYPYNLAMAICSPTIPTISLASYLQKFVHALMSENSKSAEMIKIFNSVSLGSYITCWQKGWGYEATEFKGLFKF